MKTALYIILFALLPPAAYASDEVNVELKNLRGYCDQNEAAINRITTLTDQHDEQLKVVATLADQNEEELDGINVTIAQQLVDHQHADVETRLRFLEAEAQKAETAIAIMKWVVGMFGLMLPVLGVKVFYRSKTTPTEQVQ